MNIKQTTKGDSTMNIKQSKYFTARDLKVIRALGYSKPEVDGDWRVSEEIYLGEATEK